MYNIYMCIDIRTYTRIQLVHVNARTCTHSLTLLRFLRRRQVRAFKGRVGSHRRVFRNRVDLSSVRCGVFRSACIVCECMCVYVSVCVCVRVFVSVRMGSYSMVMCVRACRRSITSHTHTHTTHHPLPYIPLLLLCDLSTSRCFVFAPLTVCTNELTFAELATVNERDGMWLRRGFGDVSV
jgi:hypothetical protein